jgi:hypothetical protein
MWRTGLERGGMGYKGVVLFWQQNLIALGMPAAILGPLYLIGWIGEIHSG